MSDTSNYMGFIILYILSIEWTSIIINELIIKGFVVSAGYDEDKGRMFSLADENKISHAICLKICKKDKQFTRTELATVIVEILKNKNISVFGGIALVGGEVEIIHCNIEKIKEIHPYR